MLLRLVRTDTDDQGTFGEIYDEDRDFLCFTVEPPWRDNKQLISCILPGSYPLEPWNSRKYPGTLHVLATPMAVRPSSCTGATGQVTSRRAGKPTRTAAFCSARRGAESANSKPS